MVWYLSKIKFFDISYSCNMSSEVVEVKLHYVTVASTENNAGRACT